MPRLQKVKPTVDRVKHTRCETSSLVLKNQPKADYREMLSHYEKGKGVQAIMFPRGMHTHRGSFLARTLASNLSPFLTTYSASLSMTAWMSSGGGIIAGAAAGAAVATAASPLKLLSVESGQVKTH